MILTQTRKIERYNFSKNIKHIHWDIITMCNYKCTYCYSRENDYQWNKISSNSQIENIINKFQNTSSKLEVILLGGEPTMHPKYFNIIDRLFNINNIEYMCIISNGNYKNPEEFILKHLHYISKFHFYITFHAAQIQDIKKFKKLLLLLKYYNFQFEVSILLYDGFRNEILDIVEFCSVNNIYYYSSMLFDHDKYKSITDDFKDWIINLNKIFPASREIIINNDKNEEIIYNDIECYLNSIDNFKGFKCVQNTYYIPVNSESIIQFCSEKEIYDLDILNEEIICPLNKCLCPGKITDSKRRN